jgi:hypothetical protein
MITPFEYLQTLLTKIHYCIGFFTQTSQIYKPFNDISVISLRSVLLVEETGVHREIRVITKLPNSEQSYKGKVKTHKYIHRKKDCYPRSSFFSKKKTYKEENCVIRLQKSAMVISPVQETPEENIRNPKVQ